MNNTESYIVDVANMPTLHPTHLHDPKFWEWLGRTVATFGYLEHVLARAIFALSGTHEYTEQEIEGEFEKWLPKLEKSLADTLYPLIKTYETEVRGHQAAPPVWFDNLIEDLKTGAELRNVLCHGFWQAPGVNGTTVPFFVRAKDKLKFKTQVDVPFLQRTQTATAEMAAAVMTTVTLMGYQFPGSSGPGRPITGTGD